MKIATERLLGIALIAGGALVGGVLIVLLSGYAQSGRMTAVTATIAVILGLIFLVLPQLALGIYLIWHDVRQSSPNEEI